MSFENFGFVAKFGKTSWIENDNWVYAFRITYKPTLWVIWLFIAMIILTSNVWFVASELHYEIVETDGAG